MIFTSFLYVLHVQRFVRVPCTLLCYMLTLDNVYMLQDDGTILTISIDANFGLCRKRSAGKSVSGPKTENAEFVDQASVDNYVQTYSSHSNNGITDKVSRM